jgi:hypothetical protein
VAFVCQAPSTHRLSKLMSRMRPKPRILPQLPAQLPTPVRALRSPAAHLR